MIRVFEDQGKLLAGVLILAAAGYLAWKVSQSSDQALQFAFNGLSVGAIYALLAVGFTLVYSTVWFFDLYYGAAAAMGAYGVFYLRSQQSSSLYQTNNLYLNIVFALVVAGLVAWVFRSTVHGRLRGRIGDNALLAIEGVVAAGVGMYTWTLLAYPEDLYRLLSPAVGLLTAGAAYWIVLRAWPIRSPLAIVVVAVPAGVLGAFCGYLVYGTPGSSLYLSWGVSCLLAGAVGLALYRGLYVYMRERSRSPLTMLVGSLGILLAITAFITIVFQSAPRPLPEAFGSNLWSLGGANIKAFNVFTIGIALAGFVGLLLLLQKTSFGKAVRAIGDDEDVAKVVGINTRVVIAAVFFIGAVFAALAGILNGHDTNIQPKMALLLLLKGWIASVIGGMGNLYGAIVGGFTLGIVEQFGIWDLAGGWKDAISFVLLILFLAFWPRGILPRR
ncbi:MAG: branched-chain amino acid ABC transporter permease [Dehalococcoidia bacterium]|nr:branched-chain amino acid ABC transporter permease [Dehalococcoidia bacterium]